MRIPVRRSFSVRTARGSLWLAALLFLVSGAALFALSSTDAPPPLESLSRDVGRVRAMQMFRNVKRVPYLQLTIGGVAYTVHSFNTTWLDSIQRTLHAGDLVTVWSREVPNGSGQLWQLARGDSLIVPYAERSDRKSTQNGKVAYIAAAFAGVGALLAVAGFRVRSGPGPS